MSSSLGQAKEKTTTENKMTTEIPETNLRNRISIGGVTFLRPQWQHYLWAAIWGIIVATAFPPFDISPVIWLITLPLAFLSPIKNTKRAFLIGFYFGFAHFFANLFWLHTIHFLVIFPLAGYCALYNGFWLTVYSKLQKRLKSPTLRIVSATACWIMFDWIRAHLLTGFPWNFPGIALWQNPDPGLIRLTGVYGETFLIIFTSLAISESITLFLDKKFRIIKIVPFTITVVLLLTTLILNKNVNYDKPTGSLKALPVQGNIPLCRDYTPEQLFNARDTYISLSKSGVKVEVPDLVIWPETAVPAPLRRDPRYYPLFQDTFQKLEIPVLVGSIDYRRNPQKPLDPIGQSFNSAMFFDKDARLTLIYDKTHPVPFGEFVPLGKQIPQLEELIGMGRGLTAGTQFTVFDHLAPAYFGVNICYEDAFPGISRKFVLNGANVLMTITNDAWYQESSGSRQHFAHSIFRAIENNVYFLRSGNRSYTSLTAPDGRVVQCYEDKTGNVFVAKAEVFDIPFSFNRTLTFYTKYGDLFALFCTIIAICSILRIVYGWFTDRKKLYQEIVGEKDV